MAGESSAHVERVKHGDVGDSVDTDLATKEPVELWDGMREIQLSERERRGVG
jgi:hypothetical protein